jgi:probable HAF family extracellular repeat protein
VAGFRQTQGRWGRAILWEKGQLTDLGTLGGRFSTAYAINDRGQVVGESETLPATGQHAFLWQSGRMQDLGIGDGPSEAHGINNRGQVVGWFSVAPPDLHAFLWEEGQMRDLGTLGGASSWATGINDEGQVTGWSKNAQGEERAFLWEAGRMLDLGTLGGPSSSAAAINNDGQVVGSSSLDRGPRSHPFIWEDGQMDDLGSLGDTWSEALAINDDGVVVGHSGVVVDTISQVHAFVSADDGLVDLNALLPPGSSVELMRATGINDSYQIVGETCEHIPGFHCRLFGRAFILTLSDDARAKVGASAARRTSASKGRPAVRAK